MLLDLAPLLLPADRAVTVGLILTELIINATKYAYDGAAGPLEIALLDERHSFRLTVADRAMSSPSVELWVGTKLRPARNSESAASTWMQRTGTAATAAPS